MADRSVGGVCEHPRSFGGIETRHAVRWMRRLVATAVVCMFVAAPLATAGAAPFPPRLNYAYDLALNYWGTQPTGCLSIDKEVVAPGSLGDPEVGAISGRSTQVPAGAAPGSVPCILWIDRAYTEPIIFDLLCAVMVHHVGHLLGNGYSSNPSDVMSPTIPVPALCKIKGRQSARLYMLRLKFHWLQAKDGARAVQARQQTLREINAEAQRFWALG